jgi:NAD(P)-dependent dehydrogenase (short-subunit alcohol dehydrogenase family)
MTQAKALVVGGSGGIGSAISVGLAQAGIGSALIGRNREALTVTAEECKAAGTNAFPIVCDISHIETIEAAVSEAIEKLGGLNYLINCAGVSIYGKLHEADLDSCDAILDTNLRSHYYLARYALPEINRQPGGAVIKIGAVNHPRPGVNVYLAANRGLEGYAEALFEDVREFGTRVCTIKPGYVNTPLVGSDDLNSALMIQPEDISRTVLFVISMPETACPTEIVILPQRSPYR